MIPGSQFPHSSAYESQIAGNDAANLQHYLQTGVDLAKEARDEEMRFLEVFGEDPFQYTLNERYARWQAYREQTSDGKEG